MENQRFLPTENEDRRWVHLHVKAVASEISDYIARTTNSVLGDSSAVGPMMEAVMIVVSRFLAIHNLPLRSGTTRTLLRASFRRRLQRRAAQLNLRERGAGCNDLEEAMLAFINSGRSANSFIESVQIVRLLSQKSRVILGLRDLGYTWKEISRFLGVSKSAARKSFREELQIAMQIADHAESRQTELELRKREHARRAQPDSIPPLVSPIGD